jgi:hypothetical protein
MTRESPFFGGRLLIASLLLITAAEAGPIEELRQVSIFRDADLARLTGGDVLSGRGGDVGSNRGLSVQSAFLVKTPVARTLQQLRQFSPVEHRELRVYLQEDLPARPTAANFGRLASLPINGPVRALIEATQALPRGGSQLLLSNEEAQRFTPGSKGGSGFPADVADFWARTLSARASAFASGGVAAEPPYQTGGQTINAADELARLVSGQVKSRFGSFFATTGYAGSRGSAKPELYWQVNEIEDVATVSLGAAYTTSTAKGAQVIDGQYYASNGVYTVLTLQQLWPVPLENGEGTLIWRIDLTSSPQLARLRGVEKLGSGAAMMREVQKAIRAFKSNASQ